MNFESFDGMDPHLSPVLHGQSPRCRPRRENPNYCDAVVATFTLQTLNSDYFIYFLFCLDQFSHTPYIFPRVFFHYITQHALEKYGNT